MGEEVEITTKSPSPFRCLCASPFRSLCASPFRSLCALPASRPLFLFRRMLSGLFVCLFPGIECRLSSSCSRVFSPAGFFVLFPAVFRGFLSSIPRISAPVYIPPDAIRHPLLSVHPSRILARTYNTNNPAISDRAASFSSSVLFAGDGVFGTVIDISGRAAKPDTRADYRLRHHLCLFYYWLLIHLFHNNYCLLC